MAGELNLKTGLLTQAPQGATINNGIVTNNPNATGLPSGWDAQTYANFKQANPSLEPNAEDTARMLNAGVSNVPGVPVLPQPNTRSLISQTSQPGYIQGYDTQQGYAPVFVPKGQYVAGISATPNQITTESLKSTSGYTLPNGQPGTAFQAEQAMASAKAFADQQAARKAAELAANPPPTDLQNQLQSLLQGQVDNANQGVTALQEKNTALNDLNSSTVATQVDDISQQLQENLAKSAALDIAYQNANLAAEGNSGTLGRLSGEQAKNYREYTIQKNNLAAQSTILQGTALGLQGKYDRAKNLITDAFNSKVDIINAQQKSWEAQVAAIQPSLTREENAHLEIVKAQKAKELQDATDLKNAQNQAISNLYAAGVAPDSDTTLALNNAKSEADVRAVMAKFGEQLSQAGNTEIVDLGNRKVLINSQTGQTIKDLGVVGKVGGGSGSGSGSGGGAASPITQAIIENPSLFDDLTSTQKAVVIKELQGGGYNTSNLGTKPLSDSAINKISDTQKAIDDLSVLTSSIDKNIEYIGPITGFARLNPWSKANQLQADINRVKQTVGKALEGGVLRKEDEEKYKKILPVMNDTAETVRYKLSQISASIQKDIETYKSLQQSGGRSSDINAPLVKKGQSSKKGSTSGGNSYTISNE